MPARNSRTLGRNLSSARSGVVARGGSTKREVARTSGQRPPKSGDSQSPETARRIAHAPCLQELDRILLQQASKARNAALRCKPTMWAYHDRMQQRLTAWFSDSSDAVRAALATGGDQLIRCADGGVAGAALALVQRAQEECCRLPRDEAADIWAMSVYANRILGKWTLTAEKPKRSLRWLRERGGR